MSTAGREHRDWRADAACLGADPSLFFPEPDEPSDAGEAICRTCPVVEACKAQADAEFVAYGVWGVELRGA